MIYLLTPAVSRAVMILFALCLSTLSYAQHILKADLFLVNAGGQTTHLDGNTTMYNPGFDNGINANDIVKPYKQGVNFGILRNGQTFALEQRKLIGDADTTAFRIWNLSQREYQLQIITSNFDQPRIALRIKDNYKDTYTEVEMNDTSSFKFTVNTDPASYNSGRFVAEFFMHTPVALPISFIQFDTYTKFDGIMVEWSVINEVSITGYVVEHSTDGRTFKQIEQRTAGNTGGKYTYFHKQTGSYDNFYRIKATRLTGSVEYSDISKVAGISTDVTIFPNPVVTRSFQLRVNSKDAGDYKVSLISITGAKKPLGTVHITLGQTPPVVQLPADLSAGVYNVHIETPAGKMHRITLLVL